MVLLVLVIGFVALNLVAARQVYALTHFVPAGASLEQQLTVPLPQKLWTLLRGVRLPRPMNHATPDEYGLPYEVRIIPLDPQQYLEAWYIPHPEPRGIIIMFAGYAGVKESLLAPAAHFINGDTVVCWLIFVVPAAQLGMIRRWEYVKRTMLFWHLPMRRNSGQDNQ